MRARVVVWSAGSKLVLWDDIDAFRRHVSDKFVGKERVVAGGRRAKGHDQRSGMVQDEEREEVHSGLLDPEG